MDDMDDMDDMDPMGPKALALDQDMAGGRVTATATRMKIEGKAPVRSHDEVESHGEDEDAAATMKEATSGSGDDRDEHAGRRPAAHAALPVRLALDGRRLTRPRR